MSGSWPRSGYLVTMVWISATGICAVVVIAINEGPDGRPVGFDFESPLYDDWYRQSPVRSIVAERVVNTYASTYRSVP